MRKTILVISLSLISTSASPVASNIAPVVAIIDTGYDQNDELLKSKILIKNGKRVELDLTGEGIHDENGHGTAIMHTILSVNPRVRFLPIKIYNKKTANNFEDIKLALKILKSYGGISIINYSSEGIDSDDEEKKIIEEIVRSNISYVASAGNGGNEISIERKSFPASYKIPGVYIVTGEDQEGKIDYNYSKEYVHFSTQGYMIYDNTLKRGSSIGTAVVSGLISVIKLVNPQADQKQIREILKKHSKENAVTSFGSISIQDLIADVDKNNLRGKK